MPDFVRDDDPLVLERLLLFLPGISNRIEIGKVLPCAGSHEGHNDHTAVFPIAAFKETTVVPFHVNLSVDGNTKE